MCAAQPHSTYKVNAIGHPLLLHFINTPEVIAAELHSSMQRRTYIHIAYNMSMFCARLRWQPLGGSCMHLTWACAASCMVSDCTFSFSRWSFQLPPLISSCILCHRSCDLLGSLVCQVVRSMPQLESLSVSKLHQPTRHEVSSMQ